MKNSIHYIDSNSAPRYLMNGDQLLLEHMPVGTRCIYAKPPLVGLKDPDAAIRYALNHPEGESDPLHAMLTPGMKVTIAFDDISIPLPPMRRPDIRQRVIEIVLEILADHGVDDIHLIAALAIHRRMTPDELRHVVGDKVYNAYAPDRLYNHDAEDPDGITTLGETEMGEHVDVNKRAAESDLLIYVNMNLVPMNGGHKSVATGLCSYKSLRAHHNPKVMSQDASYMDPPHNLHHSIWRQGRVIQKELKVFQIETTINNRMFDGQLDFLTKQEESFSDFEWTKLRGLKATLDKLPDEARQALFYKSPAAYELTGVWAGETEAVHEKALERGFEQYMVDVKGQADILISGLAFVCPYNVHAYLNPLLVQVMAQGYYHNLYRGSPLLKKGGTLIIAHPFKDKFTAEHHAPYIEFVHRLLPETRDSYTLHKKYERQFAEDPTYVEMYRHGNAYHGAHPFYMWYWGEAGRQHMGRVIVAGAQDPYMCELFGYEPAANMQEAIEMARDTAPPSPQMTLLHTPPIMMCNVTPEPQLVTGQGSAA